MTWRAAFGTSHLAAAADSQWACLYCSAGLKLAGLVAGARLPAACRHRPNLIPAVAFDHRALGDKFQRMFPAILALDQLVVPFLLAGKIGFGAAFAATVALLYVPFSERTLVRPAYPRPASL